MFLELNSKGLYQRSGKEKLTKLLSCVVRPRQNVNLGTFTPYDRAVTAKQCTKQRDASAKLLFCQSRQSKPIVAFLPFSLPSPLLKFPINTCFSLRAKRGVVTRNDVLTTCFLRSSLARIIFGPFPLPQETQKVLRFKKAI